MKLVSLTIQLKTLCMYNGSLSIVRTLDSNYFSHYKCTRLVHCLVSQIKDSIIKKNKGDINIP